MSVVNKRKRIKELEQTILENEARMKWQADRIAWQQKQLAARDDALDKIRAAVGFARAPVQYGGGGGGGYVDVTALIPKGSQA